MTCDTLVVLETKDKSFVLHINLSFIQNEWQRVYMLSTATLSIAIIEIQRQQTQTV